MPSKFDFAHVTQLTTLDFTDAQPPAAEFTAADSDFRVLIEAHAPNVYRLRWGTDEALRPAKPRARDEVHAEMLLARQEPVGDLLVSSALCTDTPCWRLAQGEVVLEISSSPLQFALYRGDHCLLRSPAGATVGAAPGDEGNMWRVAFQLDANEALHGLGDTQGNLDRRGEVRRSDLPEQRFLPLVWSTAGWGLYVNVAGRVDHDLCASEPNLYQIGVHNAPVLDLFLFVGDPSEILNQYTGLTGRPGQPGLPPMGVWLDQAPGESTDDTIGLVQALRENGFALDAVELAPPAPFGFLSDKNNIEWDPERVAEPRDFFNRLDEQGIQLVAPTLPAVLAGTPLFDEWEDRGWLLINDDGDAVVIEGVDATGGKPFGLLDLTHKDVYRLWVDRVRQLVDEGLTIVSCQAQFNIPDDVTARRGESGPVLRTLYPAMARQAMFEAIAGHKTPQEGVVASTDLFPGAHRYAWQRGPCVTNDWEGMERSLRSALALGDSGVALQSHGLGCAHHPTDAMTPELYVRWLSMVVFSGNFHFQGVPALLPTAFDEKTQEHIRHWLNWRYRLIPYVLGIVEDSVRTGLPVQRSMAQAFPDDPVAQAWDTQYMFGPALLVAPILKPGNRTQVYLPEGDAWWDLSTGWRYEGGTTWTVEADLDALPVFGREGHILSLGPTALHTGEFNSARILDEVWMFGMPEHSPVVMRNRIRVMQMQGSSYIKGLEGLRILPSEGLEVKRRGAEVRISRAR